MNSTAPSNREKQIFEQALDLASGAERQAFVKDACNGDDTLCVRVLALLQAHETDAGFLPAEPTDGAPVVSVIEKVGDRIGRYRLMEKIGEGGCGLVYVAEQEEPVRRKVALKVIKLGMDTRQVVARFEAERQALALMDHPNIARVFDGGATETGRPYFVMELVRGIRITDYCDQNKLPTHERLNLFIQVCHAIQHAHQKGIIHRDIKPSNVLVTLHDGVPVPKVIDFGIAKAMEQKLTEKTIYTAFEQFIGTPAYTSPEQAEMSGLDIDTRSDIYALGVLLYELLTGKTPFDGKELAAAGLEEMRRTIREKEPVRPSTRLRTMVSGEQSTTAERRRTEAPRLIHLLRGDLDWIVMKCLEKDRTRRYDTANGLAEDIEHHLRNEPVEARPPSTGYRAQKFVRRNKVMVAAGTAVAAALVLGIVGSTWQAVRATRAEREQSRLRSQAQTNELKAVAAEAKEARLRKQAQAQGYASDMRLAQEALAKERLGEALKLLNRHRPRSGETDIRGWEWRYLWGRCQGDTPVVLPKTLSSVASLAVSPDGKWLATGEYTTGTVSILDLQTHREVSRLPGGDAFPRLDFSPTESLLAFSSASTGNPADLRFSVRFWSGTNRGVVAELPLDGRCAGLAFSGDGRGLVTFTDTHDPRGHGQITLWSVPEGRRVATYPMPPGPRDFIGQPYAVARDLSTVAYTYAPISDVGAGRSTAHLLELATGSDRWTVESTDMGFLEFVFAPDGRVLASTSCNVESRIRLFDVATGRDIGQLEGHQATARSMLFSPDGQWLISGGGSSVGGDETIRLWHIPTRQSLGTFRGHRAPITGLALLPNQTTLISGADDGSVLLWDLTKIQTDRPPFQTITNVSLEWRFTTNSETIVTLDRQGRVARWQGPDFLDGQPLLELGTNAVGVRLSKDGRLIAKGSTNGVVEIWDLRQRTRLHQLTVSTGEVRVLEFLADGKGLVTVHLEERPGLVRSVLPFIGFSTLAILHPEAVSVHEWDLSSGRETRRWRGPWPADTFAVAQSPDERRLLALGFGGTIWLGDRLTDRETVRQVQIGVGFNVAFSRDGKRFAAAGWAPMAKVWDTDTLREITAVPEWSLSAAFSPDGQRLALGAFGKRTVTLWDVENQHELLALEGKGANSCRSEFSPDGNILAAINGKGVLHLWRAPSWAEIEAAEAQQAKDAQSR